MTLEQINAAVRELLADGGSQPQDFSEEAVNDAINNAQEQLCALTGFTYHEVTASVSHLGTMFTKATINAASVLAGGAINVERVIL